MRVERVTPRELGPKWLRYVSAEAIARGISTYILGCAKSTMHAVSDVGAVVEWLQEQIEFGQDRTTRTIWSMSLD